MSELFPNQPSRQQLLAEFQAEDDVLGIIDSYQDSMRRRAAELKDKAESETDNLWAAQEAQRVKEAIVLDAPIVPFIQSIVGHPLQLCLRREYVRLGLAVPSSSITAAILTKGDSEYIPEPGFNNDQTSALLDQLTRYMFLSK